VQSNDIPAIGVLSENRAVGQTGGDAHLVVPELRGWDTNAMALVPTDRPPEKSGVLVRFDVRSSHAAIGVLTDGSGKPLPVGAAVTHGDGETVVGYDGEAYLQDLQA